MNVLICDDETKYLSTLKAHVREYMRNRFVQCCIESYNNPADVIANHKVYDLAFLDIQMNDFDGISVAKELQKRNRKVIIFFVTSHNEYQDDAMDLRVFRFFEKPFDPQRLYAGLDKAMEYIDNSYVDFYLQIDNSHRRILVDDVLYIERKNRRSDLYTLRDKFVTKEPFEDWDAILPNTFFYQVHKSFLVNLHYVDTNNYTEITMTNGVRIPVASRKQADFHKFWFLYIRGR